MGTPSAPDGASGATGTIASVVTGMHLPGATSAKSNLQVTLLAARIFSQVGQAQGFWRELLDGDCGGVVTMAYRAFIVCRVS